MPGLVLTYHFAAVMGDIGKPIRETERPAPVRAPAPPEREPAPEPRAAAAPLAPEPAKRSARRRAT